MATKLADMGVDHRYLMAAATTVDDLIWADGIIFATPENFGALSGMMKDLLDRTYYPLMGANIHRPYAIVVSASTGGEGCHRQMTSILNSLNWVLATEPLVVRGRISDNYADVIDTIALRLKCDRASAKASELAEAFYTGLEMGIF